MRLILFVCDCQVLFNVYVGSQQDTHGSYSSHALFCIVLAGMLALQVTTVPFAYASQPVNLLYIALQGASVTRDAPMLETHNHSATGSKAMSGSYWGLECILVRGGNAYSTLMRR